MSVEDALPEGWEYEEYADLLMAWYPPGAALHYGGRVKLTRVGRSSAGWTALIDTRGPIAETRQAEAALVEEARRRGWDVDEEVET